VRLKLPVLCVILFSFSRVFLFTQTHLSVPLEDHVYYILEQAQLKGLCAPLPGARPYTRNTVLKAINEILDGENVNKLIAAETEILEQYLEKFSTPDKGLDLRRGIYRAQTVIGKNDTLISANIGAGMDIEGSGGFYSENYFGAELWARMFINGDLGGNVSWGMSGEAGIFKTPREKLGEYNTYYSGFGNNGEYENRLVSIYSEPMSHFPYRYKKRWDGSVFFFNNLTGFEYWPDSAAGGYNFTSELTGSFLENKLIMRMGRLSHEWGSTSVGSSLAFNRMARPFFGVETEFNPVPWFGIASLTGALEYNNEEDIKKSSMSFQNLFSVTMMQFRYKNYVYLDMIDAVVYTKRLELGYISPITNSFFYQNNIGDFDNMAMTFNLKVQYPGWGNLWVSFFLDEMKLTSDLLTLDRQMIAMQGGVNIPLPLLSFSSIKLSYTKVNPYTYTHNRNFNPWGSGTKETAYVNNGVGLGYYLPPNSDEILLRFTTMPVKSINTHLQYQLVRHGADFGPSAVDGSNYKSELDPDDRDSNPVLNRFFLHDGAYQWSHIARVGAEWSLPRLPITLTCEVGAVLSYFTNIDGKANVTGAPHEYEKIDTADYPKTTGFIATFGFRVFL